MPVASLVLHMIARGALVLGRICRFPAVRSSEGGVSAVMRPHRLMDCRWIGASPRCFRVARGVLAGMWRQCAVCRIGSRSVALRVASRVSWECLGNDSMPCLAPLLMAAALGAAPVRWATHMQVRNAKLLSEATRISRKFLRESRTPPNLGKAFREIMSLGNRKSP